MNKELIKEVKRLQKQHETELKKLLNANGFIGTLYPSFFHLAGVPVKAFDLKKAKIRNNNEDYYNYHYEVNIGKGNILTISSDLIFKEDL
jgi:hypothetical protein